MLFYHVRCVFAYRTNATCPLLQALSPFSVSIIPKNIVSSVVVVMFCYYFIFYRSQSPFPIVFNHVNHSELSHSLTKDSLPQIIHRCDLLSRRTCRHSSSLFFLSCLALLVFDSLDKTCSFSYVVWIANVTLRMR